MINRRDPSTSLWFAPLLGAMMTLSAHAADTAVVQWNDQALQAIRDTHPGPPIVARMLAITNTCMFDAWAAYDKTAIGTRLGASLRVPPIQRTDANKQKAISYAAFRCLKDLFPQPAEMAMFTTLMTTLGYDPNDPSMTPTAPAGIGNIAAPATATVPEPSTLSLSGLALATLFGIPLVSRRTRQQGTSSVIEVRS